MAGFQSTVEPLVPELISPHTKLLVNKHGSIRGIQSEKGGTSRDFVPGVRPLTSAQIASPTAAMIADTDATYQLNVEPYERYRSDGAQLIPLGGAGNVVGTVNNFCGATVALIPENATAIFYTSLTVKEDAVLIVQGRALIGPLPFGG